MLIKKILHGYRGGLDFNNTITEHCYLDKKIKLTLNFPICNPKKSKKIDIKNYPYTESGWFDKNHNQIAHYKYVAIHESYWFYWPIIRFPLSGELGDIRVNITISKLGSSITNNDELGFSILEQYNDYYNSPIIEKLGKGYNTEIFNKIEEESRHRATSFSDEEKIEWFESRIYRSGFPKLNFFDKCIFNETEWIKYTEKRCSELHKKYVYATRLNNNYYLNVAFTLSINMSHSDTYWYKHADAAVVALMESIRLDNH